MMARIDALFYGIAARFWRRRIARHERQRELWSAKFMGWKREHPDRCMYCAYTRWVNSARHMKLKLDSHYCVEGIAGSAVSL